MKIPKSWSEITIKQYLHVKELLEDSQDDIDFKIKLLSILTGEPEETYLNMEMGKFSSIANGLSFLSNLNISKKIIYSFRLNGKRFKFELDIKKLKASGYIDIMNYCNELNSTERNMHKILAVFASCYTWYGKKIEMSHSEKADLFFNKMPITIAYPVAVFFWALWNNSIKNIEIYLEKEMKKMKKELEKHTLKNGVGS